jgi:hypothetical protein
VLVLDMLEILHPLGKYKYDTWRIHPVKCYIDNSVRLRSCIRNVNKYFWRHCQEGSQYLLSVYRLHGDEDINTSATIIPSVEILGPIT